MKIVNAYIDGFNLYHALKNLHDRKYRWLNLRTLISSFLQTDEQLGTIYYFSAIALHIDPEATGRHRVYIDALKTEGIRFVEGNFKNKTSPINKEIRERYNIPSNVKNPGHEEKESDVNIALHILRDALKHSCDKMLIVTNDTDIAPALRMAKAENPNLELLVLTPPTFKQIHHALRFATKQPYTVSITKAKLEKSLFADIIIKPNGKKIIRPAKWL